MTDENTKQWVSVKEKLPDVKHDFQTMLETQMISKPILIKLKEGLFKQTEIDGYYVLRNGLGMWSLDPCVTSQYYNLEIGTHWRYI